MIVTYSANQFAQEITSLYEQFLESLQSLTFTLESSGTRVSPKVLRDAERFYSEREKTFSGYFYRDYLGLADVPEDKKLEFWYLQPRLDIEESLNSCLFANYGTFISAIRFGGAFKGLSDLLKDMHGSMGYVVQKKAQSMQWNVRTRDGRTWSCKRMIFNACRHYAFRILTLHEILNAKNNGCKTVQIGREFDEELDTVKVDDLLYSEDLADKYFGYGSQNEVFYDIDEIEDNAVQSK